jgi:hypothetical protein
MENNENRHKVDITRNSPFLSYLGNYDLFELTIGSQLKEYSQGATTHKIQEKIDMIGLIVSGKVKLTFSHKDKG